jgi:epoxyqueuosine reductase
MRARPHELLPGTLRVISVRMNYLPANAAFARTLKDPTLGYVSRYALGRDYHKLLRNRLKKLGEKIQEQCASLNFRPCRFRAYPGTANRRKSGPRLDR